MANMSGSALNTASPELFITWSVPSTKGELMWNVPSWTPPRMPPPIPSRMPAAGSTQRHPEAAAQLREILVPSVIAHDHRERREPALRRFGL